MDRIGIGCDHGGFQLKEELKERLSHDGYEVTDNGISEMTEVDYPDIAAKTAAGVINGTCDRAVLICGTGIGMSIAANKVPGIRAALLSDVYSARMARQHNDANVICLGARTLGSELAYEIVKAYLSEGFLGGKHGERVKKIVMLEKKNG